MICQINHKDILPFKQEAEKSGLTFCQSAILYGYYLNDELVAFYGIIIFKNKAVLKNFFVPEKKRGNGYFKKLFNHGIQIIKMLGIKKVEATCTDMSINYFLQNNFKVVKIYKKYKKVINENI
jgi:N-acetylglutamate synthase-like GNAT family acetyltransferase